MLSASFPEHSAAREIQKNKNCVIIYAWFYDVFCEYKYNAYVIQKESVDIYIPMKRKNI